MREKISILVADDNVEFGSMLNEFIDRHDDMKVVGIAKDGLEAIEMISSLKPDIVILDIIMPNLDGIGVLEKASELKLNPKPLFIVLSAVGQDLFTQKALVLGAEYYMVKPFDIELLVLRIREIYRDKNITYKTMFSKTPSTDDKQTGFSWNIEYEITNLMHLVGIPPHMSGYQYLREAIIQTVNNAAIFSSITKYLYPAVAEKFNSTPQKVERCIRNAIEAAWVKGKPEVIDTLFGYINNYSRNKPTNSEFIAMIAQKVKASMKLK